MASTQRKKRTGELKPIARQRLSDVVYDQIRQAILDRRFEPGERLSIPDLAARFDVSQMPVRQAVERLQDDGLVRIDDEGIEGLLTKTVHRSHRVGGQEDAKSQILELGPQSVLQSFVPLDDEDRLLALRIGADIGRTRRNRRTSGRPRPRLGGHVR